MPVPKSDNDNDQTRKAAASEQPSVSLSPAQVNDAKGGSNGNTPCSSAMPPSTSAFTNLSPQLWQSNGSGLNQQQLVTALTKGGSQPDQAIKVADMVLSTLNRQGQAAGTQPVFKVPASVSHCLPSLTAAELIDRARAAVTKTAPPPAAPPASAPASAGTTARKPSATLFRQPHAGHHDKHGEPNASIADPNSKQTGAVPGTVTASSGQSTNAPPRSLPADAKLPAVLLSVQPVALQPVLTPQVTTATPAGQVAAPLLPATQQDISVGTTTAAGAAPTPPPSAPPQQQNIAVPKSTPSAGSCSTPPTTSVLDSNPVTLLQHPPSPMLAVGPAGLAQQAVAPNNVPVSFDALVSRALLPQQPGLAGGPMLPAQTPMSYQQLVTHMMAGQLPSKIPPGMHHPLANPMLQAAAAGMIAQGGPNAFGYAFNPAVLLAPAAAPNAMATAAAAAAAVAANQMAYLGLPHQTQARQQQAGMALPSAAAAMWRQVQQDNPQHHHQHQQPPQRNHQQQQQHDPFAQLPGQMFDTGSGDVGGGAGAMMSTAHTPALEDLERHGSSATVSDDTDDDGDDGADGEEQQGGAAAHQGGSDGAGDGDGDYNGDQSGA